MRWYASEDNRFTRTHFIKRIYRLSEKNGTVVGVLFGLTDFSYWLYVTDLGVDRAYTRQGIGRQLMKTAHEIGGGEKDIAVYLIANENAVGFYKKLGMKNAADVMQYNKIEWTGFIVE